MAGGAVLLPLLCTGCGQELDGRPQSLVFVCRSCKLAVHMAEPGKTYRLVYVRPRLDLKGERIYAPFWRMEGKVRWMTDDARKERAYAALKPLGPLFFPAFWSPKVAYHDDLTLRYALDERGLETEDRSDALLDGVRPASSLPELARYTWLSYLDRAADVTGVSVEFSPGALGYAAVPFFAQGDKLVEGVQATAFPAALFRP